MDRTTDVRDSQRNEDDDATLESQDEELSGVALDPERELEALTTLAMMDADAAAAYAAAIAVIDEPSIRSELEGFRADHLRHVADLNPLIERRGGTPVTTAASPPLLQRLGSLAASVGPPAALLSTLANEELTTSSYDVAMALSVDDETRAVIERSFEDEQRHLQVLRMLAQQLFEDDDEAEEDDAESDDALAPKTD